MTDETMLALVLLTMLAGLCAIARIEAWWRDRKRKQQERARLERDLNAALDARTDRLMRAGFHAIDDEEVDRILSGRPRYAPPGVQAFDAQLVERSGRPLHWERMSEDEHGGGAA